MASTFLQGYPTVTMTFKVKAANTVTAGAAVVGSTSNEIAMPGGANAANVIGLAREGAAAGSYVDVTVAGVGVGIANEALATIGTPLTIAATTGYLEACDAADEDVVGVLMSAATAQGDEILVKLTQGAFYRA